MATVNVVTRDGRGFLLSGGMMVGPLAGEAWDTRDKRDDTSTPPPAGGSAGDGVWTAVAVTRGPDGGQAPVTRGGRNDTGGMGAD
jgi:hypothetical protein